MESNQRIGHGEAHAKLILLGEHAVVYGQPAIAIPVNLLKIRVTLTKINHGQFIEDNDELRRRLELMEDDFEGIRQLILRLLLKFNEEFMPFSLEIDSNIPRGRGLGASAALATSITKAFFDFFDAELDTKELLTFVNFSESIVHGRASGIDAATVNSDKPVWFVKNQEIETIDIEMPGLLVIGDSGIHGLTSQAIATVQQKLREDKLQAEADIERLGTYVKQARSILIENKVYGFGPILNASQEILENLGVSHPKLDNLITTAREAGALGAKLTGSGLGGVIVALAANATDAIRISQALSKNGAQNTWIFSL
ncbi:MAG TPA: mevalonate kinase [Lactovum miscens]|uniref:mevalonate kinase n=1 Tax=Lactovum miscens TaxID=190387 RepID=UPI002ED9D3B9